jgi:hypothetical protein
MGKYIVNAPNGDKVYLNVGGGTDLMFKHLQVITNDKLGKQFPHIFIPEDMEEVAPPAPVVEKQILTEPAPVVEVAKTESPVLSLEDTLLTEPAPVEDAAPEKKESDTKKVSKKKDKKEYLKG